MFVTVHGVKRIAKEHACEFAPFGARYNVILVAPLFPKDRFRDYQRRGLKGKSVRPDLALNRISDEAHLLTGTNTNRFFMFGYSGGGRQFAHRYATAYPQNQKRIVVAAPGWDTFPDHRIRYPRGIRKTRKLSNTAFDPARFLSVPVCVMVGGKEVDRNSKI